MPQRGKGKTHTIKQYVAIFFCTDNEVFFDNCATSVIIVMKEISRDYPIS